MRRLKKKKMKLEINWGNIIKATKSSAVAVITYGVGIRFLMEDKLKELNRKTRKTPRVDGGHHSRADTDIIHIK